MWRKKFCAVMLAICCLLLPLPALAATSATTYTITEEELAALENRLNLLSSQIANSRQALTESRAALTESQAESLRLKTESAELKAALQAQNSLLKNANKSLAEFAAEERRTRQRIKRQRNTAIGIAACLLLYNLARHDD